MLLNRNTQRKSGLGVLTMLDRPSGSVQNCIAHAELHQAVMRICAVHRRSSPNLAPAHGGGPRQRSRQQWLRRRGVLQGGL